MESVDASDSENLEFALLKYNEKNPSEIFCWTAPTLSDIPEIFSSRRYIANEQEETRKLLDRGFAPIADLKEDGVFDKFVVKFEAPISEYKIDYCRKVYCRPRAPITFMALGTGAGLANQPNTCFVLELDNGARYYIDFPRNMYDAGDLSKVQNVILTHNDPDHEGDLVRLLQEKAFKRNETVNILTTESIFDTFVDKLPQRDAKTAANFTDIVPGKIHKFADGVEIEARRNLHGALKTFGLKLKYKDKVLGYSSDCKYLGESTLQGFSERFKKYIDGLNLQKELDQLIDYKIREETTEYKNLVEITEAIAPGGSYAWFTEHLLDSILLKSIADLGINKVVLPSNMHVLAGDLGKTVREDLLDKFKTSFKESKDKKFDGLQKLKNYFIRKEYDKKFAANKVLQGQEVKDMIIQTLKTALAYQSMNWFSDCDVIIHEATNNPNDSVHTYVKELEKLPKEIRDKMYLVHTPDNFVCPEGLQLLEPRRKYRL